MTCLYDLRPVMRPIEDAGGGRIRDAQTLNLVTTREVCAGYDAMLDIVQRVAINGGETDEARAARRLLREGPRHD